MSRKSSLSRILLGGACFAVAGAGGGIAYAQQANSAQAANPNSDEIVVTAQRREETIQNVPIAVSAFSESQLQDQGLNGGRDLLQSIPNVSFSKTNFTGYNFEIRGIGAAVVAAGADAGVSVHLNNSPLLANRLFEADYYDIERVEVLRGPQGTLYGRNATGGVVNVITHQPTGQFEANFRAEAGNYDEQRFTGMINVPLGDTLAVRVAATSLDRDGFGTNTTLNQDIDGRDIWAARATLAWNPTENFHAWLYYEHFNEDDNRARVGKQLCTPDPGPSFLGSNIPADQVTNPVTRGWFSQGCQETSLYAPTNLGAVNSLATLGGSLGAIIGMTPFDANAGLHQDPNLRNLQTSIDPTYQAQADVAELNLALDVSPTLTLTSLTSYNEDHIHTFEDYNRLPPGQGFDILGGTAPIPGLHLPLGPGPVFSRFFTDGTFCDPQLGCSTNLQTFDNSSADSIQWTEEVRLQSHYNGPFNFDIGASYLNLDAAPVDYWVFANTLTAGALGLLGTSNDLLPTCGIACVDFNHSPTGVGNNYYLNRSTYQLESWAGSGEFYYQPTEDLRFTLGLRYTQDTKDVVAFDPLLYQDELTWLPVPPNDPPLPGDPASIHHQHVQFNEWTGRLGFDWHLHNSFTDSTLLYAFYSRGYKAGGFNPPSATGAHIASATFDPEFVNSYEVGLKNELFDRHLVLNLTGFHYDYQGYQVSQIVNRTSINQNIDSSINGFELETVVQPAEGWRFNGTVGWLDTQITSNQQFIDLFNRTQGDPNLVLIHDPIHGSNCVAPLAVMQALLPTLNTPANAILGPAGGGVLLGNACNFNTGLNLLGLDAITSEGHPVSVKGNEMPNAPHWTASVGGQYQWSLGGGWSATARADYYWQDDSFARIFNTAADQIHGYDNLNLLFRVENPEDGLTFEIFGQNVTDETAITGSYLTDDTSGLFRNIFTNEPRTVGVRLTKQW